MNKEHVCVLQTSTVSIVLRDENKETGVNRSVKVCNCCFITFVISCHFQL